MEDVLGCHPSARAGLKDLTFPSAKEELEPDPLVFTALSSHLSRHDASEPLGRAMSWHEVGAQVSPTTLVLTGHAAWQKQSW